MHICVVTTAHPIDDVRVYEKFCRSFIMEGYSVSWVGPEWRQTNQEFRGDPAIDYRLVRKPRGKLGRLLSAFKIYNQAKKLSGVDWFYAPDPDSACLAVSLARHERARAIFDIHENYHEASLSRWLGAMAFGSIIEFARKLIGGIARKCDLVLAVNQRILDCYAGRHPNALVIRNCAPSRFLTAYENGGATPSDGLLIMHGKAERGRGTLQVLQSLELVPESNSRVVMIDSATEDQSMEGRQIADLLMRHKEQIELLPLMRVDEMAAVVSRCTAGIISYQRDLGIDSLPNRLFEYMAAGVAVIAPSYSAEIAAIIDSEQCGQLLDFENPAEIASALNSIAKDPLKFKRMGEHGRAAFLARHNWEAEFAKVNDALAGDHEYVIS